MWGDRKKRPPILAPTLSISLELWDRLQLNPSLVSPHTLVAPIHGSSDFLPGYKGSQFRWWLNKGLFRIANFLEEDKPLSPRECIVKYLVPEEERYRCFQILNFDLNVN